VVFAPLTVPGQSDTRPSGEGEWCSLPMLGPRAPRQRYAISAYVIYRYVSIYIVYSVAALRDIYMHSVV
jgi:hypothetical protein